MDINWVLMSMTVPANGKVDNMVIEAENDYCPCIDTNIDNSTFFKKNTYSSVEVG